MRLCTSVACRLIVLLEFGGESDPVHLMVSVHPKIAVANLVGKLKANTSRLFRKRYWNEIKKKLWGKYFWSSSYCVVSVGGASLEVVRQYIENQTEPLN